MTREGLFLEYRHVFASCFALTLIFGGVALDLTAKDLTLGYRYCTSCNPETVEEDPVPAPGVGRTEPEIGSEGKDTGDDVSTPENRVPEELDGEPDSA